MPAPPMDVFGIVYIIENAQQFWSELEEILHITDDITLDKLDLTLRRFISFCAAYHEQYLQSPLQLEHACDMVLASELFSFHSERMCDLMVVDAQTNTDPHYEMILYNVMLTHGRRHASFLRSQKRWQPLLPLLMDHVRLDVDPEVDDGFYGVASGSSSGAARAIGVPIEAKLRSLSVRLLYEVCRIHKMSLQDLRLFNDSFIDYLFDLVEQTRDMQDESFNYSVIKLIVSLNEQFMVASLHPHTPQPHPDGFAQQQADPRGPEGTNRILRVLMSRVGSSPTFGENLIFMLNRANRTPEDLCMQLLVLKLLYLLFTTKSMAEYFYTNDLCVLVDVFLREIGDIDEDNESLRHTYLRVLHPLLTKTQLRSMPYKRPQIVRTLESLLENESIRDVDPTTKRLVARCMSGEWCVQFRKNSLSFLQEEPRKMSIYDEDIRRGESPGLDAVSSAAAAAPRSAGILPGSGSLLPHPTLGRMDSLRGKHAKASRSVEHLPHLSSSSNANPSHSQKQRAMTGQVHHPHANSEHAHGRKGSISNTRHPSGDSMTSLPRVAVATTSGATSKHRARAGSVNVEATTTSFSVLSMQGPRSAIPQHILDGPLVDEPSPSAPPEIRVLSPVSPATPAGFVSPTGRFASDLPPSPSSSTSSFYATSPRSASPRSTTPRRAAPPPPTNKARRTPPAPPSRKGKAGLGANGGGLNAIAASSHPNLPALSTGKASAY